MLQNVLYVSSVGDEMHEMHAISSGNKLFIIPLPEKVLSFSGAAKEINY